MNIITNLIKNDKLDVYQRSKIDTILYNAYEKWAIKKAKDFKKFHKYKCTNIDINDLILSSKFGLFKSIKKYNGKSYFLYFSDIYVKSELLKTLTEHYTFSGIPKYLRTKSKEEFPEKQLMMYKENLKPNFVSYSNKWVFDMYSYKYEDSYSSDKLIHKYHIDEIKNKIWKKVSNLTFIKSQIFYLRYNYDFQVLRTYKNISKIMNLSEETIRTHVVNTIQNHIITDKNIMEELKYT
jgi:DNA-directed RNA polymerase sigma subunit (sigma70/sigma32)